MPTTESTESAASAILIVVLGMHRSGTSVLTRAMETLGADLGSKLLAAEAGNNDKGFFEDIDINRINIDVMHAAGFDWDTMTSIWAESTRNGWMSFGSEPLPCCAQNAATRSSR